MTLVRSALALVLAVPIFAADAIAPGSSNSLVAHEWGTFTTVTRADGSADVWGALGGNADLPCFVIRQPNVVKTAVFTRVRMETPVVYLYSPGPATVSVRVRFPKGYMTEWYPRASADNMQTLEWRNVDVLPGAAPKLPESKGDSHYFAARATDAAALRVRDQHEKLLFYRGTGDLQPPIRPRFDSDGRLEIRGVANAILFENRGGKVGWRVVREGAPVEPPPLTGDLGALRAALVDMLTGAGLYDKEARAMVETWRDSWFEPGMRVFYLVPREFVDRELPLEIAPRPAEMTRVFVGRAEVLVPARRAELARVLASGNPAGSEDYGRFLTAFARQVGTTQSAMSWVIGKEQEIARQAASGSCVE